MLWRSAWDINLPSGGWAFRGGLGVLAGAVVWAAATVIGFGVGPLLELSGLPVKWQQ